MKSGSGPGRTTCSRGSEQVVLWARHGVWGERKWIPELVTTLYAALQHLATSALVDVVSP